MAYQWSSNNNQGTWRNIPVALKTINTKGHAMQHCLRTLKECMEELEKTLAQEAQMLKILNDPQIIKIYGYCFLQTNDSVNESSIIVELGQPVDSFSLIQKEWRIRLQFAQDLASLLTYLKSGEMLLPDFRLQQFVIAQNKFKLCDVDDLIIGERLCHSDSDCFEDFEGRSGGLQVLCNDGKCHGLNDLLNVWKACRNIFPYLLSIGASKFDQNLVDKILSCKEGGMNSFKLQMLIKKVVEIVSLVK